MGFLQYSLETQADALILLLNPELTLPACEEMVEMNLKAVRRVVVSSCEVEVQYGARRPVMWVIADREPLEKISAPLEIRFYGGEEQRLAESARTAEEVKLTCCYQPVYVVCLIDINISALTYL